MRLALVVTAFALAAVGGSGANADNTLIGQEGTAADGYAAINGAPGAPSSNPASTNWKYQFGGTSTWSGVYSWDSNAWVETQTNAVDDRIDIECDIEMYCATSITDPKIYFHIGNPYAATSADLTAYVNGTLTSNNGQWIGISFAGQGKTAGDIDLTNGRIAGAMVGTRDIGGRDISAQSFDASFQMSWSAGWRNPDSYGDGAHNTIHDTLWWLVNGGAPGAYALTWKIQLHPAAHQPDGNYHLDPVVVTAPYL